MKQRTHEIVELVIDDDNEAIAIDAISLVTNPAIEEDFFYFNKAKNNLTLAKLDEEQGVIISPALIPYKHIYRYDANSDKEYFVYFTADTVKKAAHSYLKYQNNNNATEQHENKVTGVHTIESWIKTDKEDKSNAFGYDLPIGTWFVSMKIENKEIKDKIRSGELKGLSIEGYFVNKMEKMSEQNSTAEDILEALAEILNEKTTN